MCISNGTGAGLMSNAVWKGVPLRTLLDTAKADAGGRKVLLHGVDSYTDTFPIRSRIDGPDDKMQLALADARNGIPLKEISFAGDRGVARVELSVDDGQNWQEAKIDYPGTELTWALWSFPWKSDAPGDYQLTVRATDRKGQLQAFDE